MPAAINRGKLIKETLIKKTADQGNADVTAGPAQGPQTVQTGRVGRDSDARQQLLKNIVFGRIRWLKSVGAPQSPTLNQGFTIIHLNTTFTVSDGGAAE